MKEKLEKIDSLLAKLCVSGDDVMVIAASRSLLREVYEELTNGKQENRRSE